MVPTKASVHQKNEAFVLALATEDYLKAAAHEAKKETKKGATVEGSIGLWKIKATAKIQEAGQKLKDKQAALSAEHEDLQGQVNQMFKDSEVLDTAVAELQDDLNKKRASAAAYIKEAMDELDAYEKSLKDMDLVDAIKSTIEGAKNIGQRSNQGALKELNMALRSLKKALDDHQRAARLRSKAAAVTRAEAAIPLHMVAHGLIEHFKDSVGSSVHEARAGINACYMFAKHDINRVLQPMQWLRRAEKHIRQRLLTTTACTVDLKEPPIRKKLQRLIEKNFEPTTQAKAMLPTKGDWVDKAGCPSCC